MQHIARHQHKTRFQLADKGPKQQQRRQAPQRQHAFLTSSTATTSLGRTQRPPDTVTNATVPVNTIYDIGLAQLNKKNKAREARRFRRLSNTENTYVCLSACHHGLGTQSVSAPSCRMGREGGWHNQKSTGSCAAPTMAVAC